MKAPTIALATACFALYSSATFEAQTTVETRSLDDIYQAAQLEEGPLQVFWGGDAGSQGDGVRKAWQARFPDVKLNLTVDLSKYHDNRIDRGWLQGLHVADIAVLQTLQDFRRWKREGKLMHYKPAVFGELLEGEKDYDGAWLPIQIDGPFGQFLYDKTKLNSSDLPTSFADTPDAKYKGKLTLTYPNDDDAVAYLFSLIVGRYGYDWLYQLAQNDVKWVRGTGTPGLEFVADHNTSSSRALSFTSFAAGSEEYLATADPQYPEQYFAWPQTGGIISSTARPESAKLFMSWITSDEYQNTTATIRMDLLQAQGKSYYNDKAMQISEFRVFEQNRADVEWWKNLFEDVLGTPQGKSPLQVYPNP